MTRRPRTAAFTLIELLVVVSIIALLISILLPALRGARKQAMIIQCASNTRQNLIGFRAYATDYKGHLPDEGDLAAGGNWEDANMHMLSNGENGSDPPAEGRHPVGLGALFWDLYLPSLASAYCPAENNPRFKWMKRSYAQDVFECYDDVEKFKGLVNGGDRWVWASYAHRTLRWDEDGTSVPPALLGGDTLGDGEKYIYSYDKGALSKHPTAAIISDCFFQSTQDNPHNQINEYHVDGLNVGYGDGHVEWLADRNRQIGDFYFNFPIVGLYRMSRAEDIFWSALDGNPGGYFYYASGANLGIYHMK